MSARLSDAEAAAVTVATPPTCDKEEDLRMLAEGGLAQTFLADGDMSSPPSNSDGGMYTISGLCTASCTCEFIVYK